MSALIRKRSFNDLKMPLQNKPDHSRYHKNRSLHSEPPGFFSLHILTNRRMSDIEYRTTGINEIDLICPLWIQLNDYMLGKAGIFRTHYE
jgi:hypothetical protein